MIAKSTGAITSTVSKYLSTYKHLLREAYASNNHPVFTNTDKKSNQNKGKDSIPLFAGMVQKIN